MTNGQDCATLLFVMSEPTQESSYSFTTDDQYEIFVYAWLPPTPPKAIVQIAHGMGEHAWRYAPLAAALNEAGYGVYANDHRGHGKSIPAGAQAGHMADGEVWSHAVADVHRINQQIEEKHPDAPRLFLGHSMGSFMAQQLLYEQPDDAIAFALSGSNGKPPAVATLGRGIARLERRRQGPRGQSQVINAMSFGEFNRAFKPNRTDFDWISRDERTVDDYVADPLCGFICSNQTWVDFLDALPELSLPENLARIPKDKPIYAFAGDRDPVGDMGKGVQRLVQAYRNAWLRDVTIKLYKDGRHEMLNETNRDEVTRDLIAWFDSVLEGAAP